MALTYLSYTGEVDATGLLAPLHQPLAEALKFADAEAVVRPGETA